MGNVISRLSTWPLSPWPSVNQSYKVKNGSVQWIFSLVIFGIISASTNASAKFSATERNQNLNLIQGTNATIKFDHLECPLAAIPYYSLRYRSVEQPFCCKSHVPISLIDRDGLKEPGQESRFSVKGFQLNNTFSVILNINDVSVQDGGMIELVYMLLNHNEHVFLKRNVEVKVLSPPPKAQCHFLVKASYMHHVVRCHAPAENGRVTISCYQASSKTPPITIYTDSNDMIRATFLFPLNIQVQCCTHFNSTENITQATCDHSIFRHTKHITTPVSNNSLLTETKDTLHVDHDLSTEAFRPTSSADLDYLSGVIPIYLQVNILVCISLFNILK